jgi:hypothetical protein
MRRAYDACVRAELKRILLTILGRPVRCERCGATLFRALPFVSRGRVKLSGAEYALVRVDFDSMNRLVFSHVEVDRCRPSDPASP